MRLTRPILLVCTLVVVLVLASASARSTGRSAPRFTDPAAAARVLTVRFYRLLERKDTAGLKRLLSPAFQLQGADGTGFTKSQFLSHLPNISTFKLSRVAATQGGSVLVVRYLVAVEGVASGKRFTPGPAPRLTVFSWDGKAWRLAAHANFNALKG